MHHNYIEKVNIYDMILKLKNNNLRLQFSLTFHYNAKFNLIK